MKKSILITFAIISMMACKKENNIVENKGNINVTVDGTNGFTFNVSDGIAKVDTIIMGSLGRVRVLTISTKIDDLSQNIDGFTLIYYLPYPNTYSNRTYNYLSGIDLNRGIHAARKKNSISTQVKLNTNTTLTFTEISSTKIKGTITGIVQHEQGVLFDHNLTANFEISGDNIQYFK
jgi:hypothetical protein